MFPSALLPFCPSALPPFCPPVGRNCGKSPLHVNMSAVAAQKMGLCLPQLRKNVLLSCFLCRCVCENGQKRRFRCRIGRNLHTEWLFSAIAAGGRCKPRFRAEGGGASPVSGRIVAGWPRFRANGGLPVTGRPGSGGFACREGESRSRGVGRLDSSANRSFHKRTCNHSRAGFPCR